MKFEIITKEEFNEFALHHKLCNFYQTYQWGNLKSETGWTSHFVAIKENETIVAATMLLEKKLVLNKKLFYSPRGLLIDYSDKKTLEFFTENLKIYAKEKNVVFLKIDPYLEYQERGKEAELIENGVNNSLVVDELKALGYIHNGFETESNLQPRWISILDLKDKDSNHLLKEMTQTTRNIIRRNEKTGVVSRVGSIDDIELFKDIMAHTSKRKGFIDRPFSYYQQMYSRLSEGNMIQLIITELHPLKAIKNYNQEKEQVLSRIEKRNLKLESGQKVNISKLEKKNNLDQEEIIRIDKKITEYTELMNVEGTEITLGAAFYVICGKEILSLFAGSYDKFMKYSSSYSTYWHMIKYAIEHKFEALNFYGISGDFNPENPRIGLFYFKRDFGCRVVELIGEYDLIIDKLTYQAYKIAMKLRKVIKNRNQK